MWGYIIAFLGSVTASFGLPSKSGRRGEWANGIGTIGVIISIVGVIVVFYSNGVLLGIITGVLVFLLPSLLFSQLRR